MIDLLINASILQKNNTGLGNYTYNMINFLCPILEENKISYKILCQNSSNVPHKFIGKTEPIKSNNFMSRNLSLFRFYADNYKLIWSTTQHGSIFLRNRQIITIHDITPLLYPKGRRHQEVYYKFILPEIIKKSVGIVTVSENTKKDIIDKYAKYVKNETKIKVIHGAIDLKKETTLNFDILRKKYGLEQKLYLCITGIHYEYKNIHTVIKAYCEYQDLHSLKVVIIGNDNNNYGRYLHKLCDQNNLNDSFIFTGYIDNIEKNTLLKNSFACLYPSLYEGFGLPLLEAMNAEVPVITSNLSSLPEIGGDAAIYFDPYDIDDLHKKIINLENDEMLRLNCINKGIENLKKFNWNTTAKEMFNYLYQFIS